MKLLFSLGCGAVLGIALAVAPAAADSPDAPALHTAADSPDAPALHAATDRPGAPALHTATAHHVRHARHHSRHVHRRELRSAALRPGRESEHAPLPAAPEHQDSGHRATVPPKIQESGRGDSWRADGRHALAASPTIVLLTMAVSRLEPVQNQSPQLSEQRVFASRGPPRARGHRDLPCLLRAAPLASPDILSQFPSSASTPPGAFARPAVRVLPMRRARAGPCPTITERRLHRSHDHCLEGVVACIFMPSVGGSL